MPSLKYWDIPSGTYKYLSGGMSQAYADGRYVLKSGDTMTGELNLASGGRNLDLIASSTFDYCYMGFFPRGATPTVRGGRFGYYVAGTNDLTLENEQSGGQLFLKSMDRVDLQSNTGIYRFYRSGTFAGQIYFADNVKLTLYAGTTTSSTAGVLSLERDLLICSDVYRPTVTGAANVFIGTGPGGANQLCRSTSSFRYKHAIRGLDGSPVPEVPYDRTMRPETEARLNGSKPVASDVLNLIPSHFVADGQSGGLRTRVGLIAENVEAVAPWALSDSRDSIEWPSVTAALLQVVKDQQTKIEQLETRIAALEGAP